MCHQCLRNVILGINWVIFSDDKKKFIQYFVIKKVTTNCSQDWHINILIDLNFCNKKKIVRDRRLMTHSAVIMRNFIYSNCVLLKELFPQKAERNGRYLVLFIYLSFVYWFDNNKTLCLIWFSWEKSVGAEYESWIWIHK